MNKINLKTKVQVVLMLITLHFSLFTLVGCSDTWDDHYPSEQTNGTESLLQLIQADPQLSDFLKVAKATHLYNNMHITPVTYADLLGADQALTVWAPKNGTFNADSLVALCQTNKGDSLVGQQFMANHIAHNVYNMNSSTDKSIKLFNEKLVHLLPQSFGSTPVLSNSFNMPAKNGLLHVIDHQAPFAYNVYEAITCLDDLKHVGDFFLRFEKQELDEDRSVVADIVEGQKIYSDSVMVRKNILFRSVDNIISEDSAFAMLVPTKEMWDAAVAEAKPYFNFGSVEKADSIEDYWVNMSLIRDLFYNKSMQRGIQDSIFTTSYSYGSYPYHVYYKPFEEGGIMNKSVIKDSLLCSNGSIYNLAKWPFTKEQLYFHPIHVQGERESNIIEYNLCTMNYRSAIGDTISGNGYLDIVPKNSTSNWNATFKVRNTLSGTYDICAVILPKTVANSFTHDFKPNKFKVTISYVDVDGKKVDLNIKDEYENDPYHVDTVKIATVTLPVCYYNQLDTDVKVQLKCNITSRQTQYSREMFLDCIYLRPSKEETASAKARKEANK
ncbi:MAG: hypothetical protein KBT29_05255 [Prevotellaceae bacterium]|nr:hypothetical protein [Candidatus Minthosoma caballi]